MVSVVSGGHAVAVTVAQELGKSGHVRVAFLRGFVTLSQQRYCCGA
ncbi:MAG: hypothetical protein ACLQB1_14145 [Streptosporangiaceae bacterium]